MTSPREWLDVRGELGAETQPMEGGFGSAAACGGAEGGTAVPDGVLVHMTFLEMRQLLREELQRAFAVKQQAGDLAAAQPELPRHPHAQQRGGQRATCSEKHGELALESPPRTDMPECLELVLELPPELVEETSHSQGRSTAGSMDTAAEKAVEAMARQYMESGSLARKRKERPWLRQITENHPMCQTFGLRLKQAYKRLGTAEPAERDDCASQVADSWLFHTAMSVVILLNCITLWVEADDAILQASQQSGRPSVLFAYVDVVDMVFLAIYTSEVALNIWRQRLIFFYGASWVTNLADLFLVVLGILSFAQAALLPGSNSLKMLRVCKLIKALRVLRAITMFKQLRAILTSLVASISTLMGSFVMLALFLYMFSLLFVLGMAVHLDEVGDEVMEEDRESILICYGSIRTAMICLLKATTDGWSTYYDILGPAGWVYQALFIGLVLFTQVALMNIILGLFVDQAMKSMTSEKEDRAREHQAEEKRILGDILALFHDADTDHSGSISIEEWQQAINGGKGKLPSYLQLLGFRHRDVEQMFRQCEKVSPDGLVDIEAFVSGCMKLKGHASHFDALQLHFSIQELSKKVSRLINMHPGKDAVSKRER